MAMPWFLALKTSLAKMESKRPIGALPLPHIDAEVELGISPDIQSLSRDQRDLAALGYWLNVCGADHPGRLAKEPAGSGKRVCELINRISELRPNFLSAPGIWNASGATRSAGTLAESLILQDINLDLSLLSPKSRMSLLDPCGATIAQGTVVQRSVAQLSYGNGLYRAARWALANPDFARDFAFGMNTGVNMTRFIKVCVTKGSAGDDAREVLDVISTKHNNQLAEKFSSKLVPVELSGTMKNLMGFWLDALNDGHAVDDFPGVIKQVCMFTGLDYGRTMHLVSRDIAANGAGPAGQSHQPSLSLTGLFAGFAMTGITGETMMRFGGGMSVRFRDSLMDHFSPEVIATYDSQSSPKVPSKPRKMRA